MCGSLGSGLNTDGRQNTPPPPLVQLSLSFYKQVQGHGILTTVRDCSVIGWMKSRLRGQDELGEPFNSSDTLRSQHSVLLRL